MGYSRADFRVVGVDNRPMPRYPFEFHQDDALEFCTAHGREFDAIHASPPCQHATHAGVQWRKQGRQYVNLIPATRDLLRQVGCPYVIENVWGAGLINPIMFNGARFGLRIKRDRFFETSFAMPLELLNGEERPAHFGRPFDARKGNLFYPVGHFSGIAAARQAMGIDWMTRAELAQAIPPAYTEYIGRALARAVREAL